MRLPLVTFSSAAFVPWDSFTMSYIYITRPGEKARFIFYGNSKPLRALFKIPAATTLFRAEERTGCIVNIRAKSLRNYFRGELPSMEIQFETSALFSLFSTLSQSVLARFVPSCSLTNTNLRSREKNR